ncbi:hypothetical protein L1887_59375 [Cichorium endivia]|nr:hypothetical protein L1887_59375 [Cichorium endivia]
MSDSLVRVSRRAEWGCPQAGAGSTQVYRRDGRVLPTTIDATASPRAYRQLGLWPPHQSAPVHAPSRSADRLSPFHIRPGRIAGPHSLPSRQFQALFDSLFKVLFIFPSRASSQDDTLGSSSRASLTAHDTRHNTRVFSTTTSRASTEGDSSLGQPHHKHGETNLRPDAMCPDKGCMVGGDAMRDAQAGLPSAGWLWAQLAFKNSMVHGILQFTPRFDNDPSAGSPTETLLRLLLPLNDKVQWNSRDVAGGEPAHVAAILTLHRTIQSVRSDGRCVQRAGT